MLSQAEVWMTVKKSAVLSFATAVNACCIDILTAAVAKDSLTIRVQSSFRILVINPRKVSHTNQAFGLDINPPSGMLSQPEVWMTVKKSAVLSFATAVNARRAEC
jgi:hypothetical protein